MKKATLSMIVTGAAAGCVNGLLGAGGGMVLVPALTRARVLKPEEVFPFSVSVILPVCIVSLFLSNQAAFPQMDQLLPYLLGSAAGGVLCGLLGRRIPVRWLHRLLGILILWGGVRYLW